jgi:hypothetical protein
MQQGVTGIVGVKLGKGKTGFDVTIGTNISHRTGIQARPVAGITTDRIVCLDRMGNARIKTPEHNSNQGDQTHFYLLDHLVILLIPNHANLKTTNH